MSLELGHGDEEVRAQNRFGEVQLLKQRGTSFKGNALDIVDVEVAEIAGEFSREFGKADRFDNGLRVAIERRTIADEDAGGAELEKRFARRGDDGRMRVDESVRIRAYEVG